MPGAGHRRIAAVGGEDSSAAGGHGGPAAARGRPAMGGVLESAIRTLEQAPASRRGGRADPGFPRAGQVGECGRADLKQRRVLDPAGRRPVADLGGGLGFDQEDARDREQVGPGQREKSYRLSGSCFCRYPAAPPKKALDGTGESDEAPTRQGTYDFTHDRKSDS